MADTLELIKTLPLELREQILKEYIKIKLREREYMGWDEVNEAILNAPYCLENQQITWILNCYKCNLECGRNYLCTLCYRNGYRHYIYHTDCDNSFKKTYKPLSRKTSFNQFPLRP